MNIHRRALLALALATGLTAPTLVLAEDTRHGDGLFGDDLP